MQMLYICVLCESCCSSECYILHDWQFVNAGRGCKRRPYIEEAYSRASLMTALKVAMSVSFCLPHPVPAFIIYRGFVCVYGDVVNVCEFLV